MPEPLCLAQGAMNEAGADATAARICRDSEWAKQQRRAPSACADVPEADRPNEKAAVACNERQSVGREAALAQPLGGLREACRAKGRVEQALARRYIGRTFVADGRH